jgi:hypothetical protein
MPITMTLIKSHTIESGGAASINFTDIPQTYTDLMVKVSVRNNANAVIRNSNLRINGNTSSIYSETLIDGIGSGTPSSASASGTFFNWGGLSNDTNSSINIFSNFDLYIPNYRETTNKYILCDAVAENAATFGQQRFSSLLASTSDPVTSINIIGEANFITHSSAQLYGIIKQ